MQRPILATQSDYGTADGRAAALSGNILKIAPEADIYSVLDLYPEGDALNAGGMIYSVLPFFPEGTVYVSVVEDHTNPSRAVAIKTKCGRYIVAPDNGTVTAWLNVFGAEKAVALDEGKVPAGIGTYAYYGAKLAQGVDIAGLGGGHNAGGAPVKAVDGVEAVGAQIVRHSAGYGDRLLRQCGGVHGDAGGLVDQQQILIFVQDIQRIVHRLDVGVLAGQVGHIGGQQVAGAGHEPHRDGCTVDRDGAPELQPAEEAAGDVPQASQQLPDGLSAVGLGDGMGQNSHGTPPVKISIAHSPRMWYTYLTKTVKVRTFYGFQGILCRPAGGYA